MHALKKNRTLRRVVLASAATVSGMVMLLSLKPHAGQDIAVGSSSQAPQSTSSAAPAPSGSSGSSSSSSKGSGSGSSSSSSKTYTGDTVQTRWGPVQVKITVKSGKITDVTALSYPSGNPRDQEINSYAIPQLRSEALSAQSANIDSISGATYTSDGYKQSLQSALDSAGL